jgi:hypothetical protein
MGTINYTNPGWTNGTTPALNQTNLNNISNALAALGGAFDNATGVGTALFNTTNVGTNWFAALTAALGAGWTTALSSGLGSGWAAALALQFPQNYTAGEYIIYEDLSEYGTQAISYTQLGINLYVPRSGTVRFKFQIRASAGGPCYGRIYKNGSAYGTAQSMNSSTYQEFSEDLSVNAGDYFGLYIHNTSASTMYARNFRLSVSNSI